MRSHESSALHDGRFVTTRWSLVRAAGESGDPAAAGQALAGLCRMYWYPLYAYVRRRGNSHPDAEDLTQKFFARLLGNNLFANARSERGRLRALLLTSLRNFLNDEHARARAQKRGAAVSMAFDDAETRYAGSAPDMRTPESLYEREWALSLLDAAYCGVRQEYERAGRETLFAKLRFALLGERSDVPYRELAAGLGMSEGAVKVAVHRLRQRYRELLREKIAETLSGPDEIDDEMRNLLRAVST
jgi:RNA polymerase sigma-70 factor (ECF subfamily)